MSRGMSGCLSKAKRGECFAQPAPFHRTEKGDKHGNFVSMHVYTRADYSSTYAGMHACPTTPPSMHALQS